MWVKIEVRHMKEASATLLRYISKTGQYASKGVLPKFKLELTLVDLILTPSSPLKHGPCTIAYMLPFLKSMLGKYWMYLFHVSRINIHLY